MAIQGLSEYGGLYNNYRVVDIPKVDFETVKKQDELNKESQASLPVYEEPKAASVEPVEDNRSKIANLDDISLTFNTGDDYSYIGSESPLENLDMQKAISDMRKDSILEDYQYFVGSSSDMTNSFSNDDGKVFLKF